MKKISIATSCYNEAGNIEAFYNEIIKQTDNYDNYEWEFIIADNCSTDNTAEILRLLAEKDKRVKVIFNQSNYGPVRSGANAFFSATGDAVISIASDLEDPPDMIPKFINAWEKGDKVIMGKYITRNGNPIMNICRKLYYKMVAIFSEVKVEENVTGFGLYDKSVVNVIKSLNEYILILRFLCPELGYAVMYIPFNKPKRKSGKSSYSLLKYYNFALETLVLTSHVPLHLASTVGFIMSIGSIVVAIYYLIQKLIHWYTFDFGFAPIMIGLFFIGGVQLLFIVIIGEYLSSAIKRVTKRPLVIEKERLNFDINDNSDIISKDE